MDFEARAAVEAEAGPELRAGTDAKAGAAVEAHAGPEVEA